MCLVAVLGDGQHVHAAHLRLPVQLGLAEAFLLELLYARLAGREHLVAGAEEQRMRRTRLHAGGLESLVDTVVAQGALVGDAEVRPILGNLERAGGVAVLAADALGAVELDRAVVELADGALGADRQTGGIGAMEARLPHEGPLDALVRRLLSEGDQKTGVAVEGGHALVRAGELVRVLAEGRGEHVPLLALHLAALAGAALRRIVQDRVLSHGSYPP